MINFFYTNQKPIELPASPRNDLLIYNFIKYLESSLYNDKIYLPFPQTKKWFGIFVYYLGTSFLCGYVQVIMQEIYFRVSYIFLF
jgi:hypothetical protein